MGTMYTKNSNSPPGGNAGGWLVLLLFTSACMFILGVLVGRNSAPLHFDMENLENKLSELEVSVLADKDGAQTEEQEIPDEISFEFYDKLKENTKIDEYAAGRPRVLAPKYEKPQPSEIGPLRTASGKEADAAGPAPAEYSGESEKKYAIQVASLRDPEKGEQVREKFSGKGYPAFTQMAVVEGKGRWCRVRLGPYINRKQAEDDLARLQKAGMDAMIVLND